MGRMVAVMLGRLRDVLDSFVRCDIEPAIRVWVHDEDIDRMCRSASRELITSMMNDPSRVTLGMHLLFCTKNLERMGDHATNISEAIYYRAPRKIARSTDLCESAV